MNKTWTEQTRQAIGRANCVESAHKNCRWMKPKLLLACHEIEKLRSRLELSEAVCKAAIRYNAEWSAGEIILNGDPFNAALKAWRAGLEK